MGLGRHVVEVDAVAHSVDGCNKEGTWWGRREEEREKRTGEDAGGEGDDLVEGDGGVEGDEGVEGRVAEEGDEVAADGEEEDPEAEAQPSGRTPRPRYTHAHHPTQVPVLVLVAQQNRTGPITQLMDRNVHL